MTPEVRTRLKAVVAVADACSVTGVTTLSDAAETAGSSAFEQATLHDELADSLEEQLRPLLEVIAEHRGRASRFRAGAAGEQQVAERVQRILVDLGSTDWHLLVDRRWPGTRRANLDLVLVGPPGVLVIDSKNWREPRIERGSLFNGEEAADVELDKLRDQADAVSGVLADVGLAPTAVIPVLVLARRSLAPVTVRGVTVVGERTVQRALLRLGQRLSGNDVRLVTVAIDEACPPRSSTAPAARVVRPPTSEGPAGPSTAATERVSSEQVELLNADEVMAEVMAAASREPMESWMTWLHPAQAALVSRVHNGPARVRGAAGTGKTVVALHRARHLARRPGAKVLVTSYVTNLPAVHRALFERLAPDEVGQVEFMNVHKWAARLLRQRGVSLPPLDSDGGRSQFRAVWRRFPGRDVLLGQVDSEDYWWDELQAVIRGRGLTTLDEYLALTRVGRRTPLQEGPRRAMWNLYDAYRARCTERGRADFSDQIDAALVSLRGRPLDAPYTAVIVDEVQDLTCQQLRLLHALVGDEPDGLFLVGDGQQAVYPGGFTLSEAGVSIPGARSTVLRKNYRNGAEILRAALDVVSGDQFDDLDDDPELGQRDVEIDRAGGRVLKVSADDDPSLIAALTAALTWAAHDGHRLGDMAVLTRTNREADAWCAALAAHGIPTELLSTYSGRTTEAVKIGTYQRAKGLEFSCVFVPRYDKAVPAQRSDESDAAYRERAELQRRQLFVAMTRARDRLWLGGVAE